MARLIEVAQQFGIGELVGLMLHQEQAYAPGRAPTARGAPLLATPDLTIVQLRGSRSACCLL